MWLQQNFSRLGRWRSLHSQLFQLLLPPNSWLPKEVNPTSSCTLQVTVHSIFNRYLQLLLGGNLKEEKEKEEERGWVPKYLQPPKKKINKHQYTWRNKKTEISIATCFLITHQVTRHKPRYMSNLGSCIFWHAFAKSIFNIYLAKRLRITWDGWDRWEVWKEQKIERTSGMLNCITIVLILKLCVLLRSPAI